MTGQNLRGTPTTATFRGDTQYFSTQKEAYLWLIGNFFDNYPHLLKDNSIPQGLAVNYFGSSTQQLGWQIVAKRSNYESIKSPLFGEMFVNCQA